MDGCLPFLGLRALFRISERCHRGRWWEQLSEKLSRIEHPYGVDPACHAATGAGGGISTGRQVLPSGRKSVPAMEWACNPPIRRIGVCGIPKIRGPETSMSERFRRLGRRCSLLTGPVNERGRGEGSMLTPLPCCPRRFVEAFVSFKRKEGFHHDTRWLFTGAWTKCLRSEETVWLPRGRSRKPCCRCSRHADEMPWPRRAYSFVRGFGRAR